MSPCLFTNDSIDTIFCDVESELELDKRDLALFGCFKCLCGKWSELMIALLFSNYINGSFFVGGGGVLKEEL